MIESGAATRQELDDAELEVRVREQEFNAARFAKQIAQFQLKLAEAAFVRTQPDDASPTRLEIHAPCNGRVLRVFHESEGVVSAGASLAGIRRSNGVGGGNRRAFDRRGAEFAPVRR